jgi:dihydropyrimidinase
VFDLVVRSDSVVTPSGIIALDVGVRDGRVATMAEMGTLRDSKELIDATGKLLIPGGVDPHCHYGLCRPANPDVCGESQDYSIAAAMGGTTTIIDFAIQSGSQSIRDALDEKLAQADGRMAVDYGFHVILTGNPSFEILDEIGETIAGGNPTIKTLTTYSWQMDDGHRLGVMREVARSGGLSVIHAEDDAIAAFQTQALQREGKTYGAYVSQARNALVEEAAIARALLLAERAGSPLYVLHMAAASGVAALARARDKGLPAFGETLIAYLSFNQEALWSGHPENNEGLLYNNFPTLKEEEDRTALWAGVRDGALQIVSSDHMAYTKHDRLTRVGTTIDSMCGGQSAVELRVPVLFHLGVASGRISPERFVELVSTNPARLMGLYPRKGAIAVGSDADLVVIDPARTTRVTAAGLHMSSDFSCWEGWELHGSVSATVLRGTVLARDGSPVGPRASGAFLKRQIDPTVFRTPTMPS